MKTKSPANGNQSKIYYFYIGLCVKSFVQAVNFLPVRIVYLSLIIFYHLDAAAVDIQQVLIFFSPKSRNHLWFLGSLLA